jgi:hypothetical protein
MTMVYAWKYTAKHTPYTITYYILHITYYIQLHICTVVLYCMCGYLAECKRFDALQYVPWNCMCGYFTECMNVRDLYAWQYEELCYMRMLC